MPTLLKLDKHFLQIRFEKFPPTQFINLLYIP